MCKRFIGTVLDDIDMATTVMAQDLCCTPGSVVALRAAVGSCSGKLLVEHADSSLDACPKNGMPDFSDRRILKVPRFSTRGGNLDIVLRQPLPPPIIRPVGIITKQMSGKSRPEQCVQTMDIMRVTRKLNGTGNAALRRKDQMFTHPAKPAIQSGTESLASQTIKSLFAVYANSPADFNGVRVDDKKGGLPS